MTTGPITVLGIFVADETIDGLDPERGLAILWSQIIEEQYNRKEQEELGEGNPCD